jgi:hypothetical protein
MRTAFFVVILGQKCIPHAEYDWFWVKNLLFISEDVVYYIKTQEVSCLENPINFT